MPIRLFIMRSRSEQNKNTLEAAPCAWWEPFRGMPDKVLGSSLVNVRAAQIYYDLQKEREFRQACTLAGTAMDLRLLEEGDLLRIV